MAPGALSSKPACLLLMHLAPIRAALRQAFEE